MFPDVRGQLMPGYQRHEGSILIDEIRADIPNDIWVAASRDQQIITARTLDGLVAKMKEYSEGDLSIFAIAFITEDSA